MNLKDLIKDYLEKARMMQVATVVNNKPWACTVYFAYDKDFNLYWISSPTRRHSKEIEQNENVAGVIALPHTPGNDVRGIQFEGKAQKLETKNAIKPFISYVKRYGLKKDRVKKILSGKDGHSVYKIKPSLIVLLDETNFPENPRQELHI